MWSETRITQVLGIRYPIIQAPMAGGVTTPQLVAAVSQAGGLGSIGGAYMAPGDLRTAIRMVRGLTNRPFAVNLFTPESIVDAPEEIAQSQALLQRYRDELGIASMPGPTRYAPPFDEQIAVVIEERVPVFSFTFGIPDTKWLRELKQTGVTLIGTATTVHEAIELEAYGIDMIVGQGSEAGAHRGTFLSQASDAMIGTLALIPQIADRVRVPVIAAGGIMDGRGIVAALALGAEGVQMGTAFLGCPESGASSAYKDAVLNTEYDQTAITRAFSGKAARGIKNRFMLEMETHESSIPSFPIQNALTRDIRQAAAKQGRAEFLSLWAGQAASMSRARPAGQLIEELVGEVTSVLQRMGE
jgi:nitronate monooxygenase